jgi:hypothetical protein
MRQRGPPRAIALHLDVIRIERYRRIDLVVKLPGQNNQPESVGVLRLEARSLGHLTMVFRDAAIERDGLCASGSGVVKSPNAFRICESRKFESASFGFRASRPSIIVRAFFQWPASISFSGSVCCPLAENVRKTPVNGTNHRQRFRSTVKGSTLTSSFAY